MEYAPQSTFLSGSPGAAGPALVTHVEQMGGTCTKARAVQVLTRLRATVSRNRQKRFAMLQNIRQTERHS